MLLVLPAFLPSVSCSFFTQSKGVAPPGSSPRFATVHIHSYNSVSLKAQLRSKEARC